MQNIEVKARCKDLDKVRAIADRLKTGYLGVLQQTDTYFKTKTGRLKLREMKGKAAQLIPYKKDYKLGPTQSDYSVLPTDEPERVKNLLKSLLGVECVIDKTREVFLIDNVRVHLDKVAGLGHFVELEAVCETDSSEEFGGQEKKIDFLTAELGIDPTDMLDQSYIDYFLSL